MTEQELIILVDEMKKIKLNFADLLEIAIDYSSKFVNDYPEKKEPIDIFFADKSFINQMTDAVRESTVLALYAIMIDEKIDFSDKFSIDENGIPHNDGLISFFNPKHISALLCNYGKLKEDCFDKFSSDSYYLMKDLEDLIDRTLKFDYPLYYDLMIYKIDGKQNIEIQQLLQEKYNMTYTVEYLSSLWRNKIPKLIAEKAEEDYLIWHYTEEEKGKWKRCSRCGEIKLAHNKFFSKNKTSRDGFYSICKVCRNKKPAKKS